jgi:WD40 repeat protein
MTSCSVLAWIVFVTVALAQSPYTFTATGSMTKARSFHTATPLNDGKVLIAGGGSDNSAELYDPSTGAFTATGNMTAARTGHTATLLPDGTVLIAGGSRDHPGSAEIYDPASGTFTATKDMLMAQEGFKATLLTNGRVLIAGGFSQLPTLADAELYDPVTRSFIPAGAYAISKNVCDFCSPAILLPDGKVLVSAVQPAQLYDSVTATFSATGRMLFADHTTATLLMNGDVLFTGGEADEVGRYAGAELYVEATGTFASASDMVWRRVWHSATLLPDGTVLVAGGETDGCAANICMFAGSVATAELYDPTTGKFAATVDMTVPRETHTATLLMDGRVLLTGGVRYGGIGMFFGSLNSAEIYTPASLSPAPVLPGSANTDLSYTRLSVCVVAARAVLRISA